MNDYTITRLQELKEKVFGSAEFERNAYFRGCTRLAVMTSDNVYFKVKINDGIYHNKNKMVKAIYDYSYDADRAKLAKVLTALNIKVVINNFIFPRTIASDQLVGQDPEVEQTISLRPITSKDYSDEDMVDQLQQWSEMLNSMDEPNPYSKIPKFEMIEVVFFD